MNLLMLVTTLALAGGSLSTTTTTTKIESDRTALSLSTVTQVEEEEPDAIIPRDWWDSEDPFQCCADCYDYHRSVGLPTSMDAICCEGWCADVGYYCEDYPACESDPGDIGGGPFTGPTISGPWL